MLFFWSWITTSKMNSSSGSNASSRFFFDSQVKNSISLIEKKPSEYKGMMQVAVGVSKNTEKPIKPRKLKKNNRKNWTVKKNRLNWFEFWKNQPVWFGFVFISPKLKKPNRTDPTEKTEPTRAKPEKTEPN